MSGIIPRWVDTHCHIDRFARRGDLDAVLARAAEAGVDRVVAIGTGPDDWDLNRGYAEARPGRVFHTVGLHPCDVDGRWEAAVALLRGHWERGGPRPVALGEIGLDDFHLPKDPAEAATARAAQEAAFAAQLAIARELAVPVVVHSREAFARTVAMIDASGVDWSRVVFHCFAGGPAEMRELNRRGGRGSFTGILTYGSAGSIRDAAAAQGAGLAMVETDAPYLAPVPHRGKPCEPAHVALTGARLAGVLGLTVAEAAAATTAAAEAFFGLG